MASDSESRLGWARAPQPKRRVWVGSHSPSQIFVVFKLLAISSAFVVPSHFFRLPSASVRKILSSHPPSLLRH